MLEKRGVNCKGKIIMDDMILYVENMLNSYDSSGSERKQKMKYNRFHHTMRVYKWMLTLYEAYPRKEEIDFEALAIATIFHDIGYCNVDNIENHAKMGAEYCRKYLQQAEYDEERIDFICDLIARHSDKDKMHDDIPTELVLLLEADLLDDTGAQGLVMDTWLEAVYEENITFESILQHMERYTLRYMQDNPMRTLKGKAIWEEKRKLTEAFVESYKEDLRFLSKRGEIRKNQ